MNLIFYIVVFLFSLRMLSFTITVINHLCQKQAICKIYQPDNRDLIAKQQGQFVY